MPNGDCTCDAAFVAMKTREKVVIACDAVLANGRGFRSKNQQTTSRVLFKILLASIWEALVVWLRFKLQTDPAEASKAIAEERNAPACCRHADTLDPFGRFCPDCSRSVPLVKPSMGGEPRGQANRPSCRQEHDAEPEPGLLRFIHSLRECTWSLVTSQREARAGTAAKIIRVYRSARAGVLLHFQCGSRRLFLGGRLRDRTDVVIFF